MMTSLNSLLLAGSLLLPQEMELDQTMLKAHVELLTSEAFGGRRLGEAGAQKTLEFLVAALMRYGLEPGGSNGEDGQRSYLQRFEMQRYEHMLEPQLLLTKVSGQEQLCVYGKDFTVRVKGLMRGTEKLEVFQFNNPGYPNSVASPERALVFSLGGLGRQQILKDRGLLEPDSWGLELVPQERAKGGQALGRPPVRFEAEEPDAEGFDAVTVFGQTAKDLSWLGYTHVQLIADERHSAISLANVIALLPGSDPALAGESVLLQAFYDHESSLSSAPGQFDRGIQGAGAVAALLEVARLLGQGERPARTLVFLFSAGQGQDSLGVMKYFKEPAEAIAGTVGSLSVIRPGALLDEALAQRGSVQLTDFDASPLAKACLAAGLPVVAGEPSRNGDGHAALRMSKRGMRAQILGGAPNSRGKLRQAERFAPMDYAQLQSCTRTLLGAARIMTSGSYQPAQTAGSPDEPGRQ